MAESWLCAIEMLKATGWKRSWFYAQVKVGKIESRETETRGRNGKREREYLLTSLPTDAQARHAQTRAQAPSTSLAIEKVPQSLPLFITAPEPVDEAVRVGVPEHLQAEADRRYAVIAPMLDFKRRTNGHRPTFRLKDGRQISNLNELAAWLAPQHDVAISSLWGWYGRFKKDGYAGLAPKVRKDRGISRVYGLPPSSLPDDSAGIEAELAKLTAAGKRVAGLYLGKRENIYTCHSTILREWQSLGLDAPPSYGATQKFLASLPKPLYLLAHGGEKKFHDACAPYVVRDYTTARALEFWVLDHAQDDFFVRNDYIEALDRLAFPELPREARLRMWFTAFMDIRCRFTLGYTFSVHPSSTAICSALRMSILRVGRAPRYGLLDRGEDMKKMGLIKAGAPLAHAGALARLIKQQWGQEPCGVIFSIGEHPQSKPIESWFKTKRNQFDSLVPSYCGNKPTNRPQTCDAMLGAHDAFLAGKRASSPLPPASQAIAATIYWIEEAYNRRHRHTGHGMGRRTPEQVLRSQYSEAEQATALAGISAGELDEFLWDRQRRKVFSEGCVRLYNEEYEPADSASIATLRVWNGREVLVAADPHNLGDAVALDPETGATLGRLVSKKLLAWGASKDLIREKMRKQRRFRRATAEYIEGLAPAFSGPEDPFAFLGAQQLAATGTENALPARRMLQLSPASEPGGRRAPAFVSDAVEQDAGFFDDVKVEE